MQTVATTTSDVSNPSGVTATSSATSALFSVGNAALTERGGTLGFPVETESTTVFLGDFFG